MFANAIVGSARFLRMGQSARLLYYDLGMRADDDGIVEAFTVMRETGASEDDLKLLAAIGLSKRILGSINPKGHFSSAFTQFSQCSL